MRKILTSILFLSCLFGMLSCSDDNEIKPITLQEYESNTLSFIYPSTNENGTTLSLQGGDGNYSVTSKDNEVVTAEMISGIDFRVKVVGLGETTIIVTDKSQNALTLLIKVDYMTRRYVVRRHDIKIVGGDLTENEKKVISEKYLAEIPVKVNGGYKFIYSEEPYDKGKAMIYPKSYGNNAMETTFEMKEIKKEDYDGLYVSEFAYQILINEEKRTFVLGRYIPSTRKTENIPIALKEDITKKVQQEYPKAEQVYTSQLIEVARE